MSRRACVLVRFVFGTATVLLWHSLAHAQTCPPGTRVDPVANVDQRMPSGTCSVRGYSRAQCTSAAGIHFKPDDGSGFTECFFRPLNGTSAGPEQPAPRRQGDIEDQRRRQLIAEGNALWREAAELFRARRYDEAKWKFNSAAAKFSAAGDTKAAALAETEVRRSRCYGEATERWDSADSLVYVRDDANLCRGFPEIQSRISARIAQLREGSRRSAAREVLVLVNTASGRFYGVAKGDGDDAKTSAADMCTTLKANTATTSEDRQEPCDRILVTTDECVALASSHDMYWGASAQRHFGASSAATQAEASTRALAACKQAGGNSCNLVPEAQACMSTTPGVSWRWQNKSN